MQAPFNSSFRRRRMHTTEIKQRGISWYFVCKMCKESNWLFEWCQVCTYKTIKPKQKNNYRRTKKQQRKGDAQYVHYTYLQKVICAYRVTDGNILCFFVYFISPKDTGTSIIFIHPSTETVRVHLVSQTPEMCAIHLRELYILHIQGYLDCLISFKLV